MKSSDRFEFQAIDTKYRSVKKARPSKISTKRPVSGPWPPLLRTFWLVVVNFCRPATKLLTLRVVTNQIKTTVERCYTDNLVSQSWRGLFGLATSGLPVAIQTKETVSRLFCSVSCRLIHIIWTSGLLFWSSFRLKRPRHSSFPVPVPS